ncbi:hypothetical protein Tcan_16166 [Toxocara canis]|uniref:Uncharacterized protein n=1 Tax=Toxocara canis TaxID=6265 RepID=A0A0B2VN84_TOXCA|nr:hypothetical protein Tcan_16166 [Toxocara canis]
MAKTNFKYINDAFERPRKMGVTGEICCTMNGAGTRWCQAACKSAMYAPTLSVDETLKRVEYFCDNGIPADAELLACVNHVVQTLRDHTNHI